jgi:hypothetical protein
VEKTATEFQQWPKKIKGISGPLKTVSFDSSKNAEAERESLPETRVKYQFHFGNVTRLPKILISGYGRKQQKNKCLPSIEISGAKGLSAPDVAPGFENPAVARIQS